MAKVALNNTEESCQRFCSMFADWLKSAIVTVDHSRLAFDLQIFPDFFLPNLRKEQSIRNTEKSSLEKFLQDAQKTIPSIPRVNQFNKKDTLQPLSLKLREIVGTEALSSIKFCFKSTIQVSAGFSGITILNF